MWYVVIHMTFLVSALILVVIGSLEKKNKRVGVREYFKPPTGYCRGF